MRRVVDVKGFVGNFDVTIRKKPRYVDMTKCTGCGSVPRNVLRKLPSEWNLDMGLRKAIYKPFGQAVPNVPVIDKEHCLFFTKGKCKICQKLCPAGAIDYEQKEELVTKKFGAIIVATGFTQFDPSVYGEYGAGKLQGCDHRTAPGEDAGYLRPDRRPCGAALRSEGTQECRLHPVCGIAG